MEFMLCFRDIVKWSSDWPLHFKETLVAFLGNVRDMRGRFKTFQAILTFIRESGKFG